MRKADLLSQIPQGLIPQADAYEGLLQGLSSGQNMLSPGAVPWGAWGTPRTVQAARTLMLGMLTGQLLSGALLHIALILRYCTRA